MLPLCLTGGTKKKGFVVLLFTTFGGLSSPIFNKTKESLSGVLLSPKLQSYVRSRHISMLPWLCERNPAAKSRAFRDSREGFRSVSRRRSTATLDPENRSLFYPLAGAPPSSSCRPLDFFCLENRLQKPQRSKMRAPLRTKVGENGDRENVGLTFVGRLPLQRELLPPSPLPPN